VWLFLEALDVWLFRDGRPFDALSDHRARSLFPPLPTVTQGAVRSHYLALNVTGPLNDRATIGSLVGSGSDVKELRLRGPFLARREGGRIVRYFPRPSDAVSVNGATNALKPASGPEPASSGVISSCPTPQLLGLSDEQVKGGIGGWLAEDDLRAYLRGNVVTAVTADSLFQFESRVGIARNDATRVTEEGALYEVEFVRPQADVGLLLELQGYADWPSEGLLRIGGEGRAARFQEVAPEPWPAPIERLPRRFKLFFATPAYFDGGWQPRGGAWSRFFEGDVNLVAAAVGRYESVGGYDLAEARHKPSRRYVPAGSVYYFESHGQARVRPGLVQDAVTDSPTGHSYEAAIGFGQVLIEEW